MLPSPPRRPPPTVRSTRSRRGERDSFGHPGSALLLRPLPGETPDVPTLKRWFRRFIEVRDDEGAERCIVSAAGSATSVEVADMLFAAVTDHRYIDVGHPADFTNKALEALQTSPAGRTRRRCSPT
ncbi:MAG: hypothetical protein R2838_01775 [Caldilineaceae bacterium]